ncbi:hypothetical protein BDW42DRAFT_169015 [Aspergillus taichungensis]|uniref:Uncharacterized protein n=1 Tax=Aspergillus taichungensis TaxID=482145 RepID=A0A2J5HVL1_9EURO|nr:hypothetical protein BDW42DRAFT_169015 [Aspergillus taichungensis]
MLLSAGAVASLFSLLPAILVVSASLLWVHFNSGVKGCSSTEDFFTDLLNPTHPLAWLILSLECCKANSGAESLRPCTCNPSSTQKTYFWF